MNYTKHTPGPWRVECRSYNAPGRELVPTIVAEFDPIAEAYPLWRPDPGNEDEVDETERMANAVLLAASPDLLNTLIGCRDMLREAATQFRLIGHVGHAAICDRHADNATATIAIAGA